MTTATYKLTGLGPLTEVTEFKKSLITWSQNQATGYRTQAAIVKTAKHHNRCTAKAESFDFMARYLQGMDIIND